MWRFLFWWVSLAAVVIPFLASPLPLGGCSGGGSGDGGDDDDDGDSDSVLAEESALSGTDRVASLFLSETLRGLGFNAALTLAGTARRDRRLPHSFFELDPTSEQCSPAVVPSCESPAYTATLSGDVSGSCAFSLCGVPQSLVAFLDCNDMVFEEEIDHDGDDTTATVSGRFSVNGRFVGSGSMASSGSSSLDYLTEDFSIAVSVEEDEWLCAPVVINAHLTGDNSLQTLSGCMTFCDPSGATITYTLSGSETVSGSEEGSEENWPCGDDPSLSDPINEATITDLCNCIVEEVGGISAEEVPYCVVCLTETCAGLSVWSECAPILPPGGCP